jgi:hypothetical protein
MRIVLTLAVLLAVALVLAGGWAVAYRLSGLFCVGYGMVGAVGASAALDCLDQIWRPRYYH